MASTPKEKNNIFNISKNSSYWKFRKKCSDFIKNFRTSKSIFYNIKNTKFTLIDTDIAKIISLMHGLQFGIVY